MKYFDYAATALPYKDMYKELLNTDIELFGNPSSITIDGIKSKETLELSRKMIAEMLNVKSEEIIFTSGGTESDNMAIIGYMTQFEPYESNIIISGIEHPAVKKACDYLESLGYLVHIVPVDKNGIVNVEYLKCYINKNTKMISVMAVNNELGTIQPIEEISKICKDKGIVFHSDFVQTVGLIDLNLENIDMASFSAHKFGGLKGTGFLYKKENIKLKPIIRGGGQENNLRSGTINVFGNYVMARSLQETIFNWNQNKADIFYYRNWLEDKLLKEFKDKIIINNLKSKRVCNNSNISFKYIDSQVLINLLNQQGFSVSSGSACHSGLDEISEVIKAIRVPKAFQKGTIRITLPYQTNFQDIRDFSEQLISCLRYLYEGGF